MGMGLLSGPGNGCSMNRCIFPTYIKPPLYFDDIGTCYGTAAENNNHISPGKRIDPITGIITDEYAGLTKGACWILQHSHPEYPNEIFLLQKDVDVWIWRQYLDRTISPCLGGRMTEKELFLYFKYKYEDK